VLNRQSACGEKTGVSEDTCKIFEDVQDVYPRRYPEPVLVIRGPVENLGPELGLPSQPF
jgi:hypothetical protein